MYTYTHANCCKTPHNSSLCQPLVQLKMPYFRTALLAKNYNSLAGCCMVWFETTCKLQKLSSGFTILPGSLFFFFFWCSRCRTSASSHGRGAGKILVECFLRTSLIPPRSYANEIVCTKVHTSCPTRELSCESRLIADLSMNAAIPELIRLKNVSINATEKKNKNSFGIVTTTGHDNLRFFNEKKFLVTHKTFCKCGIVSNRLYCMCEVISRLTILDVRPQWMTLRSLPDVLLERNPLNFPGFLWPTAMSNMPTPSAQSTQPTTSATSPQKRPRGQRGTNSSRWLCRRSPLEIHPVRFGFLLWMKKKEMIVLMRGEIYFSSHSPSQLLTMISILFRNGTQSMLGTQLSGWSKTQCKDAIELDANDPDGADLSQSPSSTSHTGPTPSPNRATPSPNGPTPSPNRPTPSPNSSFSNLSVLTPPHMLFPHRSCSQQPSTATSSISGGSRRTRNLQGGIQASLATFLDPEAWKTHNMESSMSQFYAAQLQEATTTINRLQDNDELQEARKGLATKTSENQALQHCLELQQLQMDFASRTALGNNPCIRNTTFQNPNPQGSLTSLSFGFCPCFFLSQHFLCSYFPLIKGFVFL
ncbi:uncharacterized protein VP01_1253g2 [Puccinia sorghi]|uniref:Uncharacterized protein n=1 Tax=Puccinia sorghi TaxID=27349 RepID=A0A0L6VPM1_9BASI|nr:uncharacterized protein VP01_1253g2 [Puccinia sorghi]